MVIKKHPFRDSLHAQNSGCWGGRCIKDIGFHFYCFTLFAWGRKQEKYVGAKQFLKNTKRSRESLSQWGLIKDLPGIWTPRMRFVAAMYSTTSCSPEAHLRYRWAKETAHYTVWQLLILEADVAWGSAAWNILPVTSFLFLAVLDSSLYHFNQREQAEMSKGMLSSKPLITS